MNDSSSAPAARVTRARRDPAAATEAVAGEGPRNARRIQTSALSQHLRPTDLVPPTASRMPGFATAPSTGRFAALGTVMVLARYGLRVAGRRLLGRYDSKTAAQELRSIFEELGGLWVKIGQLIALRSDVLDPIFCDEMNRLQYRAVGFAPEESVRIIREELQALGMEEVFESINAAPFAAASISQVHLARLRKPNVDVIVKVLRPGVREVFERDFRLLRVLVGFANLFPKVRALQIGGALDELRRIIAEETDFRFEVANMRRMRRLLRDEGVVVPRVFRDYCTARIVVSECIWGVMMADYVQVKRQDPERVRIWCLDNGIDPEEVGERLFSSYLRQLMEENFFHADLHPGNIILLRNSRFALIDFGSVGTVDRQFLGIYQSMLRALGNQDFAKAADLLLRICSNVRAEHLEQMRAELIRSYRDWSTKVHVDGLPYHERNILSGSNAAGRILTSYGVSQSWDLMKLGRAWATMDASLNQLFPDMNYIRLFRSYFAGASERRLKKLFRGGVLRGQIGNLIGIASDYNEMLGPILRTQAIVLQATASKISRIGVIVARGLRIGVFGVLAIVVMTYIEQHHAETAVAAAIPAINPLGGQAVPELRPLWWVIIGVAALSVIRALGRMQRELARRE
jgi:ubiquinone biosynthesis protein